MERKHCPPIEVIKAWNSADRTTMETRYRQATDAAIEAMTCEAKVREWMKPANRD
jgi:hypothetical protein